MVLHLGYLGGGQGEDEPLLQLHESLARCYQELDTLLLGDGLAILEGLACGVTGTLPRFTSITPMLRPGPLRRGGGVSGRTFAFLGVEFHVTITLHSEQV